MSEKYSLEPRNIIFQLNKEAEAVYFQIQEVESKVF